MPLAILSVLFCCDPKTALRKMSIKRRKGREGGKEGREEGRKIE
jgi:hypothetical protein